MKRVAVIALALLAGACSKKFDTDCTVVLTPYFQPGKSAAKELAPAAVSYGFYADTALWEVAGYDDALAGVITSRESGEKRPFDLSAEAPGGGTVNFVFAASPAMLVSASRDYPIYGWRGAAVTPDLGTLYLSLTFQSFMSDTTYLQSGWYITNGYIPQPLEPGDVGGFDPDGGPLPGEPDKKPLEK